MTRFIHRVCYLAAPCVGCLILLTASRAQGANVNINWDVADGVWHDAANWDPQTLPDETGIADSHRALINNDGTVRFNPNSGTREVTWIRAGFAGAGSGHVIQTGGQLTTGVIWLGDNNGNIGTFTLEDGTLIVNSGINLSEGAAPSGFTINGGTMTMDGIYVGSNNADADGVFRINGGSIEIVDNGANQRFSISTRNQGNLAMNMKGLIEQNAGTLVSHDTLDMGREVNDNGYAIYDLNAGVLTIDNAMPFNFWTGGANVHFDFDGGTLNLLGTWDVDMLNALTNADFRVDGAPADSGNLFAAQVTNLPGFEGVTFTQFGSVPEPSTGLLALVACAAAGWFGVRRRKR